MGRRAQAFFNVFTAHTAKCNSFHLPWFKKYQNKWTTMIITPLTKQFI